MTLAPVLFLDVDDVVDIHSAQLRVHGGSPGLRDRGLLESAVAQPQQSFGGTYLHQGLFTMAAAYLFHIVSNHPFFDGNKRTGFLTALVFLDINGLSIDRPSDSLYELTMRVAQGGIDKPTIAAELERIANSTQA